MDLEDEIVFKGEIKSDALITGAELSQKIKLHKGDLINPYTDWLEVEFNGENLMIAKNPIKSNISWEDLYLKGVVYGTDDFGINPCKFSVKQDVKVECSGKWYRVTLFKGANGDYTEDYVTSDSPNTSHSEWNKIIYRLHRKDSLLPRTTQPTGELANYTDEELMLHWRYGPGSLTWCQESTQYPTVRVHRGLHGFTYFDASELDKKDPDYGWRPVLRLIGG